ncbi:S8 family serine peptidase [Facklamia lactis]|uniref:S8 family serine peptidase n=1 Tax=Facklamia lactis TaxID=2749967 RepID=UPI0018CFB189|nr:S8 family serine peptidase [Facklamia lactis]MBG9980622.1 S8 family serine peptidase [Facklamia lactis]
MKNRLGFVGVCGWALLTVGFLEEVKAQTIEENSTVEVRMAPLLEEEENSIGTSETVDIVETPLTEEMTAFSEPGNLEETTIFEEEVTHTENKEEVFLSEPIESTPQNTTNEIPIISHGEVDPDNDSENMTEEMYRVIVQTDTLSAIDKVTDRHHPDYQLAVKESEAEVIARYNEIRDLLALQGTTLIKEKDYSGIFTGFSAIVSQSTIEQLKNMEHILSVNIQKEYTAPVAEANMVNSGQLIGLDLLSEYQSKYKGENILVSVIDTGFDPYHRDFILADDIEKRYDQAEMETMIKELDLPGKWYSNKVVYGYNYADNVDSLLSTDEHGNHVAGTIGANGKLEEGGIQGIAPHVQLLLMKAFSEDQINSAVYEDVWLKAFDDSIKLGADIINMSLGMPSGFNMQGDTPMAYVIQKAREKGILPVIAAGNDRNSTWGTDYTNLASNPDNGLGGYPANVEDSLSVGSFDNISQMRRYVEAKFGGETEKFIGSFTYPEGVTDYLPLMEVGKGTSLDYEYFISEIGGPLNLSGKLVIVERGEISFNEKYQLARDHGAAGIIIYDNVDAEDTFEMTGIENPTIPIMFVTRDSGLRLIDLSKQQNALTVKISKDLLPFPVKTADNLSEFSSWGPATDLTLKPDISAPGGNIYSLMSDDRYQGMSGTSMATPHIAGAAAILMQRLYEEGILNETQISNNPLQDDLVMLMLMNTAVPKLNTLDAGASYYSPIQQGAGLLNLFNALNNHVTVIATNQTDTRKDGKLELKEVTEQFDVQLFLQNYGKKDITYQLTYALLKDKVGPSGRYTETTELVHEGALGSLTVKAGQQATVNHLISTFGIDQNQYVQGYFFLTSSDDSVSPLSVPFFGFKGDWDALPILDQMVDFASENQVNFKPIVYEDGNLDKTGFVNKRLDQGWEFYNAWNIEEAPYVFVNSHAQEGYKNTVSPILSFLRNAVDVRFSVEDHLGNKVRDLVIQNRVTKVNRLYQNEYNFLQDLMGTGWDYTNTFGEKVPEGIYRYIIEGKIDMKDAITQRYEFNIVLDNSPVELVAEREDQFLYLDIEDHLSGIYGYEIYSQEGELIDWLAVNKEETPQLLQKKFTWKIDENYLDQPLIIYAYDNSRNKVKFEVGVDGSLTVLPLTNENQTPSPEVPVVEETRFKQYGQKPVNLDEYVDESQLDTIDLPLVTTNSPWEYMGVGQNVDEVELKGMINNYQKVHYIEYRVLTDTGELVLDFQPVAFEEIDESVEFYSPIPLQNFEKNGLYLIETIAYVQAPSGKFIQHQVGHRIRVDREAPQIKLEQVFGEDEDLLYFAIDFTDNMNYVELWAGNDMIGRVDKTYDSFEPIFVSGQLLYSIAKDHIGKELTFFVYDDFGNQSEESSVLVQLLDLVKLPFEIEKIFNPNLAINEVKVIQEGEEGKANLALDGSLITLTQPINSIMEYGPVELAFEWIYQINEALPKGIERLIQQGVPGLINPISGEIYLDPIDQIIEVGEKMVPITEVKDHPKPEDKLPIVNEGSTITIEDVLFYLERLKEKMAHLEDYYQGPDFDYELALALIEEVENKIYNQPNNEKLLSWQNDLTKYYMALTPKGGTTIPAGEAFDSVMKTDEASILPETGEKPLWNSKVWAGISSVMGVLGIGWTVKKKQS